MQLYRDKTVMFIHHSRKFSSISKIADERLGLALYNVCLSVCLSVSVCVSLCFLPRSCPHFHVIIYTSMLISGRYLQFNQIGKFPYV